MALITKYITFGGGPTGGVGTSGDPYGELEEAENAEATDLVTDGDSIEFIISGTVDTNFGNLGGGAWVTGASNTMTIKAAAGSEHEGISREAGGSGAQFRPNSASGGMWCSLAWVIFENLEITTLTTGRSFRPLTPAGTITCRNMLFTETNTTAVGNDLVDTDSDTDFVYENCIIVTKSARLGFDARANSCSVNHCTVKTSGSTAAIVTNSSTSLTNSLAWGGTTNDVSGTPGTLTSVATSDTTGTTGLISLTIADEIENTSGDPASFDGRLKTGSNLIDAGSGSLSTDISGASRDANPDVGAWEYISAGLLSKSLTRSFAVRRAANY